MPAPEESKFQKTHTSTKTNSDNQKRERTVQHSFPLFKSKNPSDIANWLVSLIVTREWPGLIFAASAILLLGFRPSGGLIIKDVLPEPYPILYGQLFWLIEFSLWGLGFGLLLFREYRNSPIAQKGGVSRTQKIRVRFLSFFCAVILFFAGGFYVRQDLRAAVPPSFYLQCDVSGDCFSWGENILMSYGYIQDADSLANATFSPGNEELAEDAPRDDVWDQCKQLWRFKASAVALYDTAEATDALSEFRNECKNDAEALIYMNNLAALSKGKTYDIAVSLPISIEGGESESQEVLRGVAIAQSQINESDGIDNRGILVGIADDGFRIAYSERNLQRNKERESANHIAKKLISYPRLLGIIGHFSSDATEEASGIYANDSDNFTNIVAVSPTSTAIRSSRDYSSLGINPGKGISLEDTIFRTALDDGTVISALVERISGEYKKVGVVYEGNSTYSRLFKESFLTAFQHEGGYAMSDEAQLKCNFDRKNDYSENACLQAAKDEDVNALLLVPSTKSSRSIRDLIIRNSEDFRFPLLGADSMYDGSFLDEKTEGMLLYVTWHRSDSPAGRSDFEKAALELFNTPDINWRTATAYDATMALKRGIEIASNDFCSKGNFLKKSRFFPNDEKKLQCIRSHLAEAMSTDQFEEDGSSGENSIQFDSGDIKRDRLGTFVQVQKRGGRYDFIGLPPS